MSEIQAAIGTQQMARLEDSLAQRQQAARRYEEHLRGVTGVLIPQPTKGSKQTFQSFVILLDDYIDRDDVLLRLRHRGIEATLGTYALHAQPAFARFGYAPSDLPHSYAAQTHSISLPIWAGIPESTIQSVVDELLRALEDLA